MLGTAGRGVGRGEIEDARAPPVESRALNGACSKLLELLMVDANDRPSVVTTCLPLVGDVAMDELPRGCAAAVMVAIDVGRV